MSNTNEQEDSSNPKVKVLCDSLMGRGRVAFLLDGEIYVLRIDCPYGPTT